MTRTQVCNILGITNATITYILNGTLKNSKYETPVRFLLKLEDQLRKEFESEAFGKMCDLVIRKAKKKEAPIKLIALKALSVYKILNNAYTDEELANLTYSLFVGEKYLDKLIQDIFLADYFEPMLELAIANTNNSQILQTAHNLILAITGIFRHVKKDGR